MNISLVLTYEEILLLLEALNNVEIFRYQAKADRNKKDILTKLKYAKLKIDQQEQQNDWRLSPQN